MKLVALVLAVMMVGAVFAGCISKSEAPKIEEKQENVFVGGFSNTSVFPGTYDASGDFSFPLDNGNYTALPEEVTYLVSEYDGVDIQLCVIRPNVPEGVKVPVVVDAGPYYYPMQVTSIMTDAVSAKWATVLIPRGYAIAAVATRGSADSGGGSDMMGNAEQLDLNQSVNWLGQQPWCNGNVALMGKSYDGSTPWEVACRGNKYLKTIVPISGISDEYACMFKNGTEFRGPGVLNALYFINGIGFDSNIPPGVMEGRSAKNIAGGATCLESYKGFVSAMYSTIAGERDPLGYWSERNLRPGVEKNYKGSILLVHGLQDWNVDPHNFYPWVPSLEEKGIVVKYMLGQWEHNYPDSAAIMSTDHMRWDWSEIFIRWFDYWLNGNTSIDLGPKVQVEDCSGKWRNEESWPPKDAMPVSFYLGADGKLSNAPSDATASGIIPANTDYVGNPLAEAPNPGTDKCIAFETDPFAKELRFAGSPLLNITVTPLGPGGSATAYLYSVNDSETKIVGWSQVDLRFPKGGDTMTVVVPGTKMSATIYIEPLDVVISAGSKLRLEIFQGGYGDRLTSTQVFPVQLEYGKDQCKLTLEAFERGPQDFFMPPEGDDSGQE
ncbi:MAG: CocE/NonD family hydrolase [Candidatus Thermoplasmatota archaeon]|nr:CocE/NonD family hydrolase [Candidatus Thermoplasmatota archaeon]